MVIPYDSEVIAHEVIPRDLKMFLSILGLYNLFVGEKKCELNKLNEDCLYLILERLEFKDHTNFGLAYRRLTYFKWHHKILDKKEPFQVYWL